MRSRFLVRLVLGVLVCSCVSTSAFAQYGGGGMGGGTGGGKTPGGVYKPPKGGYSSATGIGIGAGVAAGAALAYFALHNRGSVVGCVEQSGDGNKLVNEKDKNTYALLASNEVVLVPGERVAVQGKKIKDASGRPSFQAQKLVKDYGPCKK
jgi:hypothetical protein